MTAWLLLRALELLDRLPGYRRAELIQTLGLTVTELQRWEHVSRRMYVPFYGDGIISQFEGHEKLTSWTGRPTTPGTARIGGWTASWKPRATARTGTGPPSRRTC